MSIQGTVNVGGEKYSLLQHGSMNDFDKLDKSKLGGFAFGYGAYTSVTPTTGRLTTQDITETARLYAGQNNGFVYVADIPITKSNTLNLGLSLDDQPIITQKLIDAGIIEPVEGDIYYKYKMTDRYGGAEIYSPYQLPHEITNSIVDEALASGFPVTGLQGQGPSTIKLAHGDPLSAKEKAAKVLRDAGIDALWVDNAYASIATQDKPEPYVVVLDPENFNNSIIGKYKLATDEQGRVNVETISGQRMREPSVFNKIKDLLTSFNKERPKSEANYEDLPDIDGARQARYSLRADQAKVIYEVAPDPNNVELTDRWNALPVEQKTEISKRVGARIIEMALPIIGARGRVADQVGSYLEFTNPSFALVLDEGDPIEASKLLGFALSQDSMMVVSGDQAPGLDPTGGIVIDIGEVPFDQVDAIYQQLREIEVNGEKPVGGQTTVDGKMIVLNYSGLQSSDLASLIDQKLGGQFDVATGNFFTAFPEKGEYDYASPSDDPTGSEGLIRKRSRDLRAEASRLLNDEINAVPKLSLRTPSTAVNILNGSETKPDLGKKPTVQKVGEYFDKLVQDEFGRKLDYSNGEDFSRALEIANAEVDYQLQQEKSGLDWYDQDIKDAFKETARVIPELRTAQKRHLFSIMAGIMSPQTNARDNWFIAGQAFKHYVDTGTIPGLNPETNGLWMGGTTSKNKKVQLDFLNRMVEDMGEKKAVQWLLSDHTVKEINGFRQKYGNIKSGIGGKMDDIVPGLYAFGPKVGPFVSNINGIHDVTVDLWMTRTFNRYFGTMIGPDGKISDAPTEPQRRAIKRFVNEVAQNANIKPYQAQSVLWFFEQKLYRELGTPAPSFGFSDGARKLSGRYPPTGDRGGAAGVQSDAGPDGKFSLRTTNTPEFREWFGRSQIVDEQGRPRVMYHGTARDITEFKPKQAGAIFVTEDPRFAEDFSYMSEMWMIDHADQFLSEQEIKKAVAAGVMKMAQGMPKQKQIQMLTEILQFPIDSVVRDPDATEIRNEIAKRLPSKPNILPVYVRAERPFDFENQEHLNDLRSMPGVAVHYQRVRNGDWSAIEEPEVQEAIQDLGFDGFYIKEGGRKNLAVYNPNQLKSVTGNIGTYRRDTPDIRYSLRQTNTPEFKRWFKDSKVVDENGEPLVVYHGTTSFEGYEFKPTKASNESGNIAGYYFSTLKDEANEYTKEKEGSEVIPAFLSISNPYIYPKSPITDAMRKQYYDEVFAHINKTSSDEKSHEYARNTVKWFDEDRLPKRTAIGNERDGSASAAFQRIIKAGGYNGFNDGTHWVAFEPTQIKSAIGNIGTFDPTKPDIRYSLRQRAETALGPGYLDTVQRTTTPQVQKGFFERMGEAISPTSVSRFRQMFINKYEAIEVYSKELAKKFGNGVLLADTSAIAASLMSDRAAGVAAESFKSGIPVYAKGYTYVDNMGGKVKGLMDVLMPLAQYKDPLVYQLFQNYAAMRRGVRLDAQGKVTPFTRQELAKLPQIEKEFPEFKQVFEDYQRYNEGIVRFMRDTGVISAEDAQHFMKYGDYIPFYRQLEGERTVGPNIFSAISGVKAPKKLKGGEAPLGEFLETVVRNSKAAIEAGMRNVAANRVVTQFQALDSPSGQGNLVERTTEADRGSPDVVVVRENGKEAFYKVADPLLVQSLQALNIPQIPGLDLLAKPAQFLREMVTRDPAFIGASVLRESLSAWITTGQKLTPVASGVNQFIRILGNASPEVEALRKAGIGSGYEFKGDVQSTAGEFGKQLKAKAGDMTAAQRATMPMMKMWDALDRGSTAADLSTRVAVFKRVMEETGNEAEAVYQAMEVINFSRKGSSPIVQIFAAIIPFLNARIQGLDLLYRAGFGRLASASAVTQQKAFMLRSLALLGSTAMYYALVQDDEEWKRADQETRDNYWIFGGFKFPIPFELGVMFKVIPERIMAYTMGDDTGEQVRESIARQIMGTLSFNPIPQAVLPLVEASANYSFFLQRDIVGMGKKDLAPEFQTSEGTSQIAMQLGQALGLSPMKIDYVLRGYTGAMGTYAITAMDSIIRGEDDATKATWRLDQIPVLRRFMISDLGAGTVNEYYDLREKLDEVVRTTNQLERTGNIEALQEYLKDNGQVLGMKDYIRALDKDMKSLRESRMAINMSRMEPDQKRESLDALRRAEISLTERINLLRKNMGV